MRYLFLLFFVIFFHNCAFLGEKITYSCDCGVLLKGKQQQTPLFNDKEEIISLIQNDTIKEDYFILTIKRIKNNKAYVEASAILYDTIPKFGWIDLNRLEIYPAKYASIFLYKKPNAKSSIKSIIINPGYGNSINILNCKGAWLYVSFLDIDGIVKEGWLSPIDQCSDPYSLCGG